MMSTGIPEPQSRTVTELSGWSVDVDAVVAARQRLVDGVVDHLVDEVVEAALAGRADVHARPFPDRLEALEDRDVLCGVSWFSHREKALQIPALRAVVSVSESCGRIGPREARRGRSRDQIPELFVARFPRPARRRRPASSAGRYGNVRRGPLRARPSAVQATVPGAKRSFGGASSPRRSRIVRRELLELEGPRRRARVHVQRAVARDARRPRVPRDLLADRGRPRLGEPRRSRPAGRSARAPSRTAVTRARSRLHLDELRRLDGQRRALRRGHDRLAHVRDERQRARGGAPGSSSERTSSSSRSGGASRRAASSFASASSSASTVRRCSPCEPKPRRSRSPASSRTSCRCGPTLGGRALDVALEPRLELGDGRRLALVDERRLRQARARRRSRGSRARAPRASSSASGNELGAERRRPAPSTARSRPATRGPAATRRSAAFRCAIAAA